MQYRLFIREILTVLRVRKIGLLAAFAIGVGFGVMLFSAPSDVWSTFRTDTPVYRTEISRKIAPKLAPQPLSESKRTSDASLAQLEEQERMLVKAWSESNPAPAGAAE